MSVLTLFKLNLRNTGRSDQNPGLLRPFPTGLFKSFEKCGLTGQSLKELKELMQMTFEEHQDISSQLEKTALGRYESWERGFLFKRVFKSDFALRKANAELSAAKVSELEEQLRLTTIATDPVIQRLSVRRGKRPIKTEVATVASRTIIRFQLHCTALSRSKVRVACGKSFSFQTLTVWFGS